MEMTDINEKLNEQFEYSISNTVRYFSTLVDKTVSQAEQIEKLENRLRRFELLFDGLQGIENITSSLQILDERTARLEENFSTLEDKVADTENRLDDLEESASEDSITDKIRDTLNGARISIDI